MRDVLEKDGRPCGPWAWALGALGVRFVSLGRFGALCPVPFPACFVPQYAPVFKGHEETRKILNGAEWGMEWRMEWAGLTPWSCAWQRDCRGGC